MTCRTSSLSRAIFRSNPWAVAGLWAGSYFSIGGAWAAHAADRPIGCRWYVLSISGWQAAQAASPTYFTPGLTLRYGVSKVRRGSGGGGSGATTSSPRAGGGGTSRKYPYQTPPAVAAMVARIAAA